MSAPNDRAGLDGRESEEEERRSIQYMLRTGHEPTNHVLLEHIDPYGSGISILDHPVYLHMNRDTAEQTCPMGYRSLLQLIL